MRKGLIRNTEDRVDNFMDNKNDLDLSMNQSLANKFERLYKEEKSKRQSAESELSLIKGIGNNSPEMKALKKELGEVKGDNKQLANQVEDQKIVSRKHQEINGKLQVELTESKKKECKCNTKTSTSS